MIYQDSGAQIFTANPTHDILLTVNFQNLTEHIPVVKQLAKQSYA